MITIVRETAKRKKLKFAENSFAVNFTVFTRISGSNLAITFKVLKI